MLASCACAQTLYIDNRETDKVFPERLNFRAEPSAQGDLLGLYYSGTTVEKLEDAENGYVKVTVGGVTGYMSAEYLITGEEAESLYEKDSGFFEGRAAQVDLS
ncbi:MAG: SH3 domain-containing protein, partial [Clostridia bacterium]|nr:SH3 domain-containing protein [Clostridia bacterium]